MRLVAAAGRRAASKTTHGEPQRRKRQGVPSGRAPLVLVVDDTEDVREQCAAVLGDAGLRVALAVDGDQALLKTMALKPDLIVTDLSLPVLDGWTLIRELKARSSMAHIPVIGLSGHAAAGSLKRARDAGADAVLSKPCGRAALLEVARKLLALGD
jgi:CheY-like chemotaxis protein